MKILVTGAKGFVGKNLVAGFECIRDGKDKAHRIKGLRKNGEYNPEDLKVVSYDVTSTHEDLESACKDCDFVFHFAGVNRPKNKSEFMEGNYELASRLLDTLKKYGNICPVMLSSSIQVTLTGRYEGSDYGKSKLAAEDLFLRYAEETGAKVLVYRFPNLFGKWCRPNYNSVIATFCHNMANGLPIRVDNRNTELELLYIDDLVEEMLSALNGREHRCEYNGVDAVPSENGRYCFAPGAYKVTLGKIVDLLESFRKLPEILVLPEAPVGSFEKKLFSTYLSYLPEKKACFPLKMNVDGRGSFTELLKTEKYGQFSVNVNKPGVTKGQHWHHSKWEIFIVVSGHGLIQERKVGLDADGKLYPISEYKVSGDKLEAVYMMPGYTHNLINLSDTQDLVTVIWANEAFDADHPDTYREIVKKE